MLCSSLMLSIRRNPEDITRLYTRSNKGQMIPLSALVTTRYVTGPDLIPHFNGFPAAQVTGSAAPGYSSGEAINIMEQVAREVLPQGYSFSWSGMAYEEKKSGGTSAAAFVFGLIIVFLILAAQFESWTLPGSVMTAVPFGILGALVFNWIRGLDNDVYFQIGLLVLIGLGAKNAVLRVTFATELRKQGLSIMDATIKAGEERLTAHYHDLISVYLRCPAPGNSHRRRCQRPSLNRYWHYGWNDW